MSNKIILSEDQEIVVSKVLDWYNNISESDNVEKAYITLGGYAGTGKSTIQRFIRDRLGDETVVGFVSLTGKAVNVMDKKLRGCLRQKDSLSTLHSFMYHPIIDDYDNVTGWELKLMAKDFDNTNPDLAPYVDVFINDEASMTGRDLFKDLSSYNKPMIFIGDHAQLPPISGELNLMENPELRLEKVHRHSEENPILYLATKARAGKLIPFESFSSKVKKLTRVEAQKDDRINELLEDRTNNTCVLTPYNNTRVNINRLVRKRYDLNRDSPAVGDKIICLRNDRRSGIYNGMIGVILELKPSKMAPDLNYTMKIKADDRLYNNLEVAKYHFNFNPKTDPKPAFTNLDYRDLGTLWDYGYAMTTHKAQGSQFKSVIIWGEAWPAIRNRWLYTAITRAQEELYIIN